MHNIARITRLHAFTNIAKILDERHSNTYIYYYLHKTVVGIREVVSSDIFFTLTKYIGLFFYFNVSFAVIQQGTIVINANETRYKLTSH